MRASTVRFYMGLHTPDRSPTMNACEDGRWEKMVEMLDVSPRCLPVEGGLEG